MGEEVTVCHTALSYETDRGSLYSARAEDGVAPPLFAVGAAHHASEVADGSTRGDSSGFWEEVALLFRL